MTTPRTQLDEAFAMTSERFIITGGISASEIEKLKTANQIREYVRELFSRMKPFKNRFVLAASCNTPINTPWKTILEFRDAWLEFRDI